MERQVYHTLREQVYILSITDKWMNVCKYGINCYIPLKYKQTGT